MSKNKGKQYSREEWLKIRSTPRKHHGYVLWQSTYPGHIPRGMAGHSHALGHTYRRPKAAP